MHYKLFACPLMPSTLYEFWGAPSPIWKASANRTASCMVGKFGKRSIRGWKLNTCGFYSFIWRPCLFAFLIQSLINWMICWDKIICLVYLLPGSGAQGNLATGCSRPSSSLLSDHTHTHSYMRTHTWASLSTQLGRQDTLCHRRHITHHTDLNIIQHVDHSNTKNPDEHILAIASKLT